MASYYYRLTTAKCFDYLKKEFKFIEQNYSFFNAIKRKLSFLIHISYWQGFFKLYRIFDIFLTKRTNKNYLIHKDKIEIEITTECNMRCYHCDRSCRQAPSNELMSTEQIKHFIEESIKTDRKWPFIVLIGGEPTLHPDIYEICDLFIDYKKNHSPNTKLTISTNGVGEKTKAVLKNLPEIIHQENSSKTSNKNTQFFTFNVAPIDLKNYRTPEVKFCKGCSTASTAGSALTRYGFYGCGAAASIDRVLGKNIGIKHIQNISENKYRFQLSSFCGYCGFFKKPEDDVYSLEDMSETWHKIYKDYQNKKPELSLYGKKQQQKVTSPKNKHFEKGITS